MSDVRSRRDHVLARLSEIGASQDEIDQVMAAQRDLVEVVSTLRQVLCVKG